MPRKNQTSSNTTNKNPVLAVNIVQKINMEPPEIGDRVKIIKSYAQASSDRFVTQSRMVGSKAFIVRIIKGANHPYLLAVKKADKAPYIGFAKASGLQKI